MTAVTLAVTPLTDVGVWARSKLPLIIALVVGAVLVTRFAQWISGIYTDRMDRRAAATDALVRSESLKHRHAVAQVVTWATLVLIYCLTAVWVVGLLGVPLSGFVAPATVDGLLEGLREVADLGQAG